MSRVDAYVIPLDPSGPQKVSSVSLPVDKLWASARPKNKAGETKVFFDADSKGSMAALVSLGSDFAKKSENSRREAVRQAAANGAKKLKEAGADVVAIEPLGDPHSAGSLSLFYIEEHSFNYSLSAVGATLGLFDFNTLKTSEKDKEPPPQIKSLNDNNGDASSLNWYTGLLYADCQNWAREVRKRMLN
jgi:aminopeptidase